jgi:hypothetical protein
MSEPFCNSNVTLCISPVIGINDMSAGDAIPMSDYTTIVARVAQMMAILLYLNHVIVPWMI